MSMLEHKVEQLQKAVDQLIDNQVRIMRFLKMDLQRSIDEHP